MKRNAFTMAEIILVMLIIGIISTIMITTLKPQSYMDMGLAIQARKLASEVDGATNRILMNDTRSGNFNILINPNDATSFKTTETGYGDELAALYKKYLVATRTECNAWDAVNTIGCPCVYPGFSGGSAFYLKDGSCMSVATGRLEVDTIFPGENDYITATTCNGVVFIDANGAEAPNVLGKDQFILPIGLVGIDYELKAPASSGSGRRL